MKYYKLLLLLSLMYSCKSTRVSILDAKSFVLLNKLNYASNNLENSNLLSPNSLSTIELEYLENWSKKHQKTKNFNNAECVGCNTSFSNLKPVYRIKKGKYIHFGLQSNIGIKNFVFNKKGTFVTTFFSSQGYSKTAMNKAIGQGNKDILISIYATKLTKKAIYLEHFEYSNQNENDGWYNTLIPLHFKLFIDFKEKNPEMRFIFNGGLYSLQDQDENKEYRTVNFFEPTFVLDANNKHESVLINGYTANVSFYLINIDENSEAEISINSNLKDESFNFSVLNNTSYLTLNEYLTNKKPLNNHLKKIFKKGTYLVCVKNKHNGKIDDYITPYYTLKISKSII